MPFTPSHAVVALPFLRTPLIPSAIAIGAMTPDLPLFVRGVGLQYGWTHTFGNVVWTAVIALLLFLLWRVLLRPAVAEFAPDWLRRRLPGQWVQTAGAALREAIGIGGSAWYPVLLAASLILGVLSHIGWDLFTHEGRWGVEALPVLVEQWGPLPGYKWLQHGSTALGLLIIGLWAARRLLRQTPVEHPAVRPLPFRSRLAWWLSLPVVLLAAWIRGLAQYGPLTPEFTAQHLAYLVLPPACGVWAVVTLVLCASNALRRSNLARAEARAAAAAGRHAEEPVTSGPGRDPRDAAD